MPSLKNKLNMKKITFLILFLNSFIVSAQIFENPITGGNPNTFNPYTNGQTVDPNITATGIGRGTGITGRNAGDRYNASGWNTASFDDTAYFEFTITPDLGYEIDFNDFTYTGQTSGQGPINFVFRTSLDAFSTNIGTPSATGVTIDLSGANYQNITNAITFRLYAWNAGNINGTFSVNDFAFNGTVNDISCFGATVTTWGGGGWDNGVPTINDIAIINGNYNTSGGGGQGSFSACSLVINAGVSLTIENGDHIEIENDITVDGTLTVNPEAAVVQNQDSGLVTNNGTITITKTTAPLMNWYEYTYWSSPVTNETVGVALTDSDASRRFFFKGENFLDAMTENNNDNIQVAGQDDIDDNADDWAWASGSDTMTPGVGYAATHSEAAFVGPPFSTPPYQFNYIYNGAFNNGIITVPIYRNDLETNDINWNLVGNPYPSAIDADLFLASNTPTDGAIYLWSQNTTPSATTNGNENFNFSVSDYAIINSGGTIAGGDGETPNRYIPSGQAFFISYSNAATPDVVNGNIKQGTVTFNNSMRVTTNNDQFFRSSDKKKSEHNNRLWINLTSDNGVFNQALITYINGATNDYDGMAYDAPRNLSSGAAAVLYSLIEGQTKKFAIQGKDINSINENEVVKIGFKTTIDVPTVYTLSVPQLEGDFLNNNPIVVKDNLLNISHNLKDGDYNFTSEVGEFNDRFEIVFNNASLSNDELLVAEKTLSIFEHRNGDVQFKLNSNSLQIKNIQIIDLQGRTIYNFNVAKNDSTHQLSALSQTPYIAKVTLNNNQAITKKAVKKY